MKTRIALSMAPILMFALGQQAHAAPLSPRHDHQHSGRLAANRHGKTTRFAALGGRHSRHVSFRHLAIRHVDSRHILDGSQARSYGVVETDGWDPAEAAISTPSSGLIGATLRKASFEQAAPADEATVDRADADSQVGIASYYGGRHNGRRTSSGAIFNEYAMTAAHASLPFGTKVLVRVKGTDRAIVVTITDRLFSSHRIIDLSEGAAERLGIVREGLAMVMLTPQN